MRDFGHWLLLSEGGLWVGAALIWAGLLTLAGFLVWRYGEVQMGPDPEPREVPTQEIERVGTETYVWPTTPLPPANWHPYVEQFTAAIEETSAAVIDITDTVEFHPVDPLAVTAEIERVEEDTPLFYSLRRPKPLELEGHTQGWERDGLLARIRAAGEDIERIKEMGAPK